MFLSFCWELRCWHKTLRNSIIQKFLPKRYNSIQKILRDFHAKLIIILFIKLTSAWNYTSICHYICSVFRRLLRGEELYTQTGFFFVQSIFADRYIHRRELRLVSLESSFSVEYGIKKIFLIFVFYRELSRFKLLRKVEGIHVIFIHIFRNFCLNFRQFC